MRVEVTSLHTVSITPFSSCFSCSQHDSFLCILVLHELLQHGVPPTGCSPSGTEPGWVPAGSQLLPAHLQGLLWGHRSCQESVQAWASHKVHEVVQNSLAVWKRSVYKACFVFKSLRFKTFILQDTSPKVLLYLQWKTMITFEMLVLYFCQS